METIKRNCNHCKSEYNADTRNLKRGWGLCCSKSCAAKLREKSRPSYNPKRVKLNNIRREYWNDPTEDYEGHDRLSDYDPGDSEYYESRD